jgi:acyl-CoA oxidase
MSQLFKNFVTALNKTPAGPERKVLEQVCRLYGLWQVELEAAQFLSSGYFGKEHLAKIQTEVSL